MPRLTEIGMKGFHFLEFSSLPWLNETLRGGLVRGGVYLLAGAPGIGKTTLVNQILAGLALQGRKGLYISTEQSLEEIKTALARVHGKGGCCRKASCKNCSLTIPSTMWMTC